MKDSASETIPCNLLGSGGVLRTGGFPALDWNGSGRYTGYLVG